MAFLANYGLFLLKAITIVLAILFVILGIAAIVGKGKIKPKERLVIKKLNDRYKEMQETLHASILSKAEHKRWLKVEKQTEKAQAKTPRKKIYVLNFHGDIKASAVKQLRDEITAILTVVTSKDEVVVCLESHGGMVHAYGLAASELERIRQRQVPLTVIVDKIAASGGYLMACVANRIIAAPFAIVGSIGVIAQLPNFHRLLKKGNIDYEQFMAGEYKRTVTIFGENTEKGRKKFQEEIEDTQTLFKHFVTANRPILNIDQVATGEHWYGTRAIELKLVDTLMTSDDYLLSASKDADIYQVCYRVKKSLGDKLGLTANIAIDKVLQSWQEQQEQSKYL